MSRQRIWAIVIRHLFSWPRELEAIAEAFWWPSFDLFIWGLMTTYLNQQHGVPGFILSFFLGATILWMFVYRAQQEMGLVFLREFWDRNLLNLLATPLTIGEFFLGTLILGVIKITISALWMFILAWLLFKFELFNLGVLLIPFIINLLVFGWSMGYVINGLVIRFGYRIQAFVWTLIMMIQPFSAVFYPVASLPSWMQFVSRLLPISYIFEGMRQIMSHVQFDLLNLVWASLLNLIYLGLSITFFNYCYRKARQIGRIVKFS